MENNYTSLSEKLNGLLKEIELKNKPLSIGHVMEVTGDKSFGILLLFLSMPSAIPIISTGFATLFGLAMSILLIQMFYGRTIPWLPEKVNNATLSVKSSIKMLRFSIKALKSIERLIHPRLNALCKNKIFYIIFIILATIIILPFPLTNTAPAIVIFLYAIGLIEGDGLFCLLAALIGVLLTAAYCLVFYFIFTYGVDTVRNFIQ